MKIIAVILALLITVLLGAIGTYLLIDDSILAAYIVEEAERETDTNISYQSALSISRTLAPTVTANKLVVEDKAQNFRIETDSITLQVSLTKLFSGKLDIKKLHLGDTQIEILSDTGDTKPSETSSSTPALTPSIDDLKITHLTILQNGNTLQLPEIGVDKLDLKLDTSTTPPYLSGRIVLRSSTFTALTTPSEETSQPANKTTQAVFSKEPLSLDWIGNLKLDLDITAKPAEAAESNLQSAEFHISMESETLTIKPATLIYPKGQLEFELEINAKDRAEFRLRASGKDLNPWRTLQLENTGEEFQTDLDIDIDIKSHGNSPHQLAANANGNVSLAMKNGKIRRSLLDLLFIDIVGWTINRSTKNKYSEIECGLADYSISQGVMTTKAFFIEGENIAITGDGTIDLGMEQIDYVFLPKKKTQLISTAAPVKVHGSLSNPAVTTLPWKSAAKEYGALVFAPQIFIPVRAAQHLFGKFMNTDKETVSPCVQYQASQDIGN